MSEDAQRAVNVIYMKRFRKRKVPKQLDALPEIYGRINAMNEVEYGLVGVSAADSPRLLNAVMHLGLRLLEIGRK